MLKYLIPPIFIFPILFVTIFSLTLEVEKISELNHILCFISASSSEIVIVEIENKKSEFENEVEGLKIGDGKFLECSHVEEEASNCAEKFLESFFGSERFLNCNNKFPENYSKTERSSNFKEKFLDNSFVEVERYLNLEWKFTENSKVEEALKFHNRISESSDIEFRTIFCSESKHLNDSFVEFESAGKSQRTKDTPKVLKSIPNTYFYLFHSKPILSSNFSKIVLEYSNSSSLIITKGQTFKTVIICRKINIPEISAQIKFQAKNFNNDYAFSIELLVVLYPFDETINDSETIALITQFCPDDSPLCAIRVKSYTYISDSVSIDITIENINSLSDALLIKSEIDSSFNNGSFLNILKQNSMFESVVEVNVSQVVYSVDVDGSIRQIDPLPESLDEPKKTDQDEKNDNTTYVMSIFGYISIVIILGFVGYGLWIHYCKKQEGINRELENGTYKVDSSASSFCDF